MSKHEELQSVVLRAAAAVCDHAAYLPDGNAQVPTEIAEALGSALAALADFEEDLYDEFLSPQQKGLNPAQVALQRLNMPAEQLQAERAIDAADRLYLAIFDQVIIPGGQYLISNAHNEGVRYINQSALQRYQHG